MAELRPIGYTWDEHRPVSTGETATDGLWLYRWRVVAHIPTMDADGKVSLVEEVCLVEARQL